MIRKDIKTPCVSFEFYQEVYQGSVANDKNFDNAELESEAFVDMITFGRIGRLEEIPDCVKFAICSVADVVVKYVESQKNDVVSESNDGYSITYANASNDADCNHEMYTRAKRWLANTGLLYRGWSKEYDAQH